MFDLHEHIGSKIEALDAILRKMDASGGMDAADIIQTEIDELKKMCTAYEEERESKTVVKKEEDVFKTRCYLKDGSVYVATRKPAKNYKYLFDRDTKAITYEFENGQVERTFVGGFKEIRLPDGRIYLKLGPGEYDCILSKK
ncbi:hypothetical protein ECANGB1_589 [Enterospora canceri]|uniref:Uncharacterized protein n=1 Tax=Enterospora canceri TaxID=1081671 RepID=A0A1Y1S7U7_9MICR|nr:hypothetical protein ECANGB1_589 [Enterospora canceri]